MTSKRAVELLRNAAHYIIESVGNDDAYDVLLDAVGFTATEIDTLIVGVDDDGDDSDPAALITADLDTYIDGDFPASPDVHGKRHVVDGGAL